MQARHHDRRRYFEEQALTTSRYVIPFIEPFLPITPALRVLEVGCGEGGNLLPFVELGCACVGVDLNGPQIERAQAFYAEHPQRNGVEFIYQDIYAADADQLGQFDLIILRDVIEHIFDQARFMAYVPRFLKPGGKLFIGFPPWQMPFGGHQQICRHRWLSKLPWFHLLPVPLYRAVLRAAGEPEGVIRELLEIKSTGLSIEQLRAIIARTGWHIAREQLYLINPNYEVKFGLKPRAQWRWLAAWPYIRNFWTTCGYYVLQR